MRGHQVERQWEGKALLQSPAVASKFQLTASIIPLQTAKMLLISLNSFRFPLKPKHMADTSSYPFFLEIILPNYWLING